jgi:hydroxyethylthiazole kinase-like uncharacterized protein yjeF
MIYVTNDFVKGVCPKRNSWSRKGDFGKLLVIGGSRRYSGAPALAALAALRTGCDLVTIAAPERAADIAASYSPDLITEPFRGNCFNSWHTRSVLELAGEADTVVLGSGLGRKRETMGFVHSILSRLDKPCVIDADAIHAVSASKNLLKPVYVLTPHSGEFLALSGHEPSRAMEKRSKQVRELSSRLGCTILLKGHIDVISDGRETLLNRTGSPNMTKGGTGDTLSGICGALLSMGLTPFDAASSAACLNGLAGEEASRKLGPGMLASDILEFLPKVIQKTLK